MTKQDEIDDSSAPLIEHLAELRTRLIHSVVAFVIGMVICFSVWNPIFNFLTEPLCSAMEQRGHEDCGLILIRLQEGFFVAVSISLLGQAGIVSSEGLANVRKYAVVGILIVAALVTPPDVVSQIILFSVIYGLYEISIFLVRRVETKREEKLRAEGYFDDEEFEEDTGVDLASETVAGDGSR